MSLAGPNFLAGKKKEGKNEDFFAEFLWNFTKN